MKRTLAPLAIGIVLFTAACGPADTDAFETSVDTPASTIEGASDETPDTLEDADPSAVDSDLAADAVVMIWSQTGGCAQAGPNCFRYEVLADGTVTSYREGATEVEVTAQVDRALVTAFVETVNATDVDALVATLPAGEMTATFDGVDFTLEAPFNGLNLSSIDVEFVTSEPLFSAANDLAAAAAAAAMPEIEFR